jgi:hypothetical protein
MTGRSGSFGVLLDVTDLPGDGWRLQDERTWRTGVSEPGVERSVRAQEAGCITAWRSFDRKHSGRSFWTEVIPFVSSFDAQVASEELPDGLLSDLRRSSRTTSDRTVEGMEIPGVEEPWAYEVAAERRRGTAVTRLVGGRVDRNVVALAGAGRVDAWPWPDLVGLATVQARYVRLFAVRLDET